jgi:hypothetical protein
MKTATFDKINSFVRENLFNSHSTVIASMPYGFKINGYTIRKKNGIWELYDRSFKPCGNFFSRKLSILAAIMLIKGNLYDYRNLVTVDYNLNLFKTDYLFYSEKLKKFPDNLTFHARLDRIEQELEIINLSISQIEKSFNLQ